MNKLVCKAKNKAHEMKTAIMASDKGGKEIIVELGLTVVAANLSRSSGGSTSGAILK